MTAPIDQVQLAFSPSSLTTLNVILGLVMFGVALELRVEDFKRAALKPRGPLLGMTAQFVILPAATFGLVTLLDPTPSVALGMMMVAACPGGNVSNFITHLGRGDTALSVSMTALSTAAAIVMTPLNLSIWASLRPETAALLRDFELDAWGMLGTVGLLLGVPLTLGMLVAAKLPRVAQRLKLPMKTLSLLFFFVFVFVAFRANVGHFKAHIGQVFWPVLLQNAMALGVGYAMGRLGGLSWAGRRALAIEVGIQNSGMGLVLIFGFFGGLGGMAVIAAWWGIWHIVAGLSLAAWWTLAWPRLRPQGALSRGESSSLDADD